MLLNRIEKALMNNPVRAAVQRHVEARLLLGMGGPLPPHSTALEVGCGRGVGTRIILDTFGASRVDAFDLDADMIRLAEERLSDERERVRLWVGDVSRIEAADATYDAVFDFGIIHHVPDWKSALQEIRRVLRPGGRFYAEEVLARFILDPVVRRLLDHPLEGRFTHKDFIDALKLTGFTVSAHREVASSFGWYVATRDG